MKSRSVKTVVFKKEMTWPQQSTYGLNNSYPMNVMWFLGLYNQVGQIPNCSPINLIGSTKEFLKWANQFKHFRVKKCKMTWVPMVKGPIQRVDPGKWGTWTPVGGGGPDVMTTYTKAADPTVAGVDALYNHSYQTDYEVYVADPVVMPTYGQLDPLIGAQQFYLSDRDFGDAAISNEMLPYIKHPHAKRYLMDHTWSHSWIPKVPKVFRFGYTNVNTAAAFGGNMLLDVSDGTLQRMPWLPICLATRFAGAAADEGAALRCDLTTPYIAIRDRRTYLWSGTPDIVNRTALGIPGKWHFHVTFQFKTRRSSQSAVFTDMDIRGTMTKNSAAKVTAPQNPVNN